MRFDVALTTGILEQRYKRFLADVKLSCGKTITAHTANTGSMAGCATPGSRVWLSLSDNPKRKYAYTWELVENDSGILIGINTMRSNYLVREAVEAGVIAELANYGALKMEAVYPQSRSRADIFLSERNGKKDCFVEVKNVTLVKKGIGLFPDAPSERAVKHLGKLERMVELGYRAVLLFCVQREDAALVQPATTIDPIFTRALRQASDKGVEVLAYQAQMSPEKIELVRRLEVEIV